MNSTRRSFLAAAASAAGWACAAPVVSKRPLIALQLYSIHQIFWKTPEKCLAALKAAGFDGVEFAGYEGRTAAQIRALVAAAGLKAAGTHVNGDVDLVGDALKRTLDFCAAAGIESVVTPHAQRDSAEAYRAFGVAMGKAADAAAAYGIKVGIHSTYHHFTTKYGAETAWDMIYREASPRLQVQVDTGNTFKTGYDVVGLLKRFRGRNFSVHAKENVPTVDGTLGVPPTDGGACVPWKGVVSTLNADPSVRWWIIEAEGRPDSLEPAVKSCGILRRWLTSGVA